MTILQHFLVDGKFLGTSPRLPHRWQEQIGFPPSYSFFCPVCGDVWARCPVEVMGTLQLFMVQTIACKKHPAHHGIGVPGSLMLAWDTDFTKVLPEEVLRREVLVHLDYAEEKDIVL